MRVGSKLLRFRQILISGILGLALLADIGCVAPNPEPVKDIPSAETPTAAPVKAPAESFAETPAAAPGTIPQVTPENDDGVSGRKNEAPVLSGEYYLTMDSLFGFNPASHDFAAGRSAGGAWTRPHFEEFTWGLIEREPGVFDFVKTDRVVRQAQEFGFHILANVQPKAVWDEAACREVKDTLPAWGPQPFTEAYRPCDMEAYKNFVATLVERYDGDGVSDMPGLTVPIKHWEIMNEPEFSMYFLGTPAEYVEIVEASSAAVREADSEAIVVQGGMAGMRRETTDFWQKVFDLGIDQYFDVMNMHSIGHGEHLNIPAFELFLEANGITGKPIWVTETQYQPSDETRAFTAAQFADTMARSYIFALAHRIEKLFYVNISTPPGGFGAPFDERSALIDDDGMRTPSYFAHRTIAEKLGELRSDDAVETIREEVDNWFINEGQYKFTIDGQVIYALWGTGTIPPEIEGTVTVTDISGTSYTTDAGAIQLTSSPLFVEIP